MILKKNCTFDCTYDAGKLEILLHGEIDHHSAVAIRARLDEKIYELRPSLMVMDLSEIDFLCIQSERQNYENFRACRTRQNNQDRERKRGGLKNER